MNEPLSLKQRSENFRKGRGRGRRVERSRFEGVDLWKFGGPVESTPRLVASKEGWGCEKHWRSEGRCEPIFDLRFRGQNEARTAPLCYCYTDSLLIYFHREIICILNDLPRDQRNRVVFQNLLSEVDPVTCVNKQTFKDDLRDGTRRSRYSIAELNLRNWIVWNGCCSKETNVAQNWENFVGEPRKKLFVRKCLRDFFLLVTVDIIN